MTSSPEVVAVLLATPGLVLIIIGLVSTGCVLCVIVATSCVVCRRRDGRRRQRDNRRNSRTEALKALTSSSDNGGAAACSPETLPRPSTTYVTSHSAVKTSPSSVANGSTSSAAVAGYQPVACLSPINNNNTVSLSLILVPVNIWLARCKL